MEKIPPIDTRAERRMLQRNVSDQQVVDTFLNSELIWPNRDYENVHNYRKTFDGKQLVIGVKDDTSPCVVLTVLHWN